MKLLNKVKNFIKSSKGPVTAKGKLVDYKEAHTLQYGFIKGLTIVRPKTLRNSIRASRMAFRVWESSEGQYYDYSLLAGFIVQKIVVLWITGSLFL